MDESPAYYDHIMELLKTHDKLTVKDIVKLADKNAISTRKALKRLIKDGIVMRERIGKTDHYYLAEDSAVEMAKFDELMKKLDDTVENLKKDFPTYPSNMLYFINEIISSGVTKIESIKDHVKVVTTGYKEQLIRYEKVTRDIRSMCHRHVKNPLLMKRLLSYESDSYQVFQETVKKRLRLAKKRDNLHASSRKKIANHIEKLAYIMDTLEYDADHVKERLEFGEEVPYDYKDSRDESRGILINLEQKRDMLRDSLESAKRWTTAYRKSHSDAVWENKHPSSEFDEAAGKLSEMQQGLRDLDILIRTGIEKSIAEERDYELSAVLTEVEKNLQEYKQNLREIADDTG